MKALLVTVIAIILPISAVHAADGTDRVADKQSERPLVHPAVGVSLTLPGDTAVTLTIVTKRQQYVGGDRDTRDEHIISPKSVIINPSQTKFYVNSLEGGYTVAYSLPGFEKLSVISHRITAADSTKWASPSGLYTFRHYTKNLNVFTGRPVEATFTHGGRYLWVPYYRRSFDINAQDPSAVAIINTDTDSIIRIMEAGVLPKMITTSPDGRTVAIAHWGDNTVGLIDVSSPDPTQWHHTALIAVDRQLFHDYSLTESVNRDSNSGNALRGMVFTPDSRYLFVSCMGGMGGIAVIDMARHRYVGKIFGMMPNIRHMSIHDGRLYLSINIAGYVQMKPLADVVAAIDSIRDARVTVDGWRSCRVDPGARTLEVSPDGRYIFVACNFGSSICVVDSAMTLAGRIAADSFPVGLTMSADGQWLISTSQGRDRRGGNCVDIYRITGITPPPASADTVSASSDAATGSDAAADAGVFPSRIFLKILAVLAGIAVIIAAAWRRRN